ncbi:hypothetical protein A0H81_06972 [Grifola frondosa]|uniref:Uncharacterized protein n=1 Tax=Grifola frondosa TaxID=5627 RepID=A0A1C7M9B3_GRIFR|nr:hypothetical protein A0H81_06972 [Grifola frondosa]
MVDRSAYCAGHAREMNTVGAYLGSYALPILRTSGSYGCFLSCADVDGTVVSRQCLRMFQIHKGANDGDTYHDCELEQNILHVRRILPYADVSYMAAGVDKDQEVAAGIDVKEAAAAAEEGEAAGMTNSILDVDAQQDSPHMYNLAAPRPSPRSHVRRP